MERSSQFESIRVSDVFLEFSKNEDEEIIFDFNDKKSPPKEKKGFEDQAKKRPDFEARAGEITYITGYSGAGKSLMLKILSGLFESEVPHDRKFEATIQWGDQIIRKKNIGYTCDSSELDTLRAKCFGIIFQDFRLIDDLSGEENILFPLLHHEKVRID